MPVPTSLLNLEKWPPVAALDHAVSELDFAAVRVAVQYKKRQMRHVFARPTRPVTITPEPVDI
jgi:hypothetical protein